MNNSNQPPRSKRPLPADSPLSLHQHRRVAIRRWPLPYLQGLALTFSLLWWFDLPATYGQVTSQQKENASAGPVTNESVEAGLRTRREALRIFQEFQTNDARTHL